MSEAVSTSVCASLYSYHWLDDKDICSTDNIKHFATAGGGRTYAVEGSHA